MTAAVYLWSCSYAAAVFLWSTPQTLIKHCITPRETTERHAGPSSDRTLLTDFIYRPNEGFHCPYMEFCDGACRVETWVNEPF